MGSEKEESRVRRLLRSIPGVSKASRFSQEEDHDEGNAYEFEATIGKKGSSLGFTFDKVSQALARIQEGMKARVTMVRDPGKSWYYARLKFVEPEEDEAESGS